MNPQNRIESQNLSTLGANHQGSPEVLEYTPQIEALFQKFDIDINALPDGEKKEVLDRFQKNPELYYSTIDNRLDTLDTSSKKELITKDASGKLAVMKSWMSDAERDTKAQDSGKNNIKSAEKKAENTFREEMQKKFRLTGIGFLDDMTQGIGDWLFENAKEKATTKNPSFGQKVKFFFVSIAASIFGLSHLDKKYKEKISQAGDMITEASSYLQENLEDTAKNFTQPTSNTPDITAKENTQNISYDSTDMQENGEQEDKNQNIDSNETLRFNSNWLILKSMMFLGSENNLDHSKDSNDYRDTYKKYKDEVYANILTDPDKSEIEKKFSEKISTQNFQKIVGYAFYGDIFAKLLQPNGQNFDPELLEKYGEAKLRDWKNLIQGKNLIDWKNTFTLSEITDIYATSMPVIKYGLLDYGAMMTEKMGALLKIGVSESRNSLEKFLGAGVAGKVTNFKSPEKLKQEYDQKLIDTGNDTSQKENIKKIVDFKNEIYPNILDEAKLQLNEKEKQALLKHMEYSDILKIYTITGGSLDFSTMHPMNFTAIILLFTDIMSKENATIAGEYIGRVSKSSFFDMNTKVFDDREKEVLKIVQMKFLNEYVLKKMDQILLKIGIATSGIDTASLAAIAVASGYAGHKMTQAAYQRILLKKLGGQLAKLGGRAFSIIALFAGISAVAKVRVNMNNRTSDFDKALEKSREEKNTNAIDNYFETLDTSITTQKYKGKGGVEKTFTSISYPGDTTIFFLDDKLWTFGAVEKNLSQNFDNPNATQGAKNIGSTIIRNTMESLIETAQTVKGLISEDNSSATPDINTNYFILGGIRYDISKSKILDGKIIIPSESGKKEYKMPILDFLRYYEHNPLLEDKDLIDIAKNTIYGKSQNTSHYKIIQDTDQGKSLGLIEIKADIDKIIE